MASPKLRLPESFLLLAGLFCTAAAAIAVGVALSQGPSADWTFFRWTCWPLAACVALWLSGVVDWIPEEDIRRMETQEMRAEFGAEFRGGNFKGRYWFWTAATALVLLGPLYDHYDDRIIDLNAPLPDGDVGGTLLGHTFGVFNIFGRTMTGVELAVVAACLAALAVLFKKGFARLIRANRGVTPDR